MLRRIPVNLNQQSRDATILLIREVIRSGITLSHIYVDALGNNSTYQDFLERTFPGIGFTVTNKADSKFKIVGAASVAAKVTRDACLEGWIFEESVDGTDAGKDAPSAWSKELGCGYPSDPKTQAWIKNSIDPVFGLPSIARFSWTTVKVALEKGAANVKWVDEGQEALVSAFQSATGLDKGRCVVARDLGMKSVGML